MSTEPISRNDVVRLLALAAGGDQRTVAAEDVALWHTIATHQRWTFPVAQRVVIEHYSAGGDRRRIDPATITDRIRELRGRAAESFEAPRIPDGLPNRDYPAWLRARLAEHVDRALDRWVQTGGEISTAKPVEAIGVRTLPELVAAAPVHVRDEVAGAAERIARTRPPRATRATRDPHRRAEARAQLDAIRTAQPAEPAEEATS